MTNYRPWFLWYDGSVDKTSALQGGNPAVGEYLPTGVANRRLVANANGNTYAVGDLTVALHNSKNIIWSSEGYTFNGNTIPALTAAQKKATGLHTANAGTGALDISYYRSLVLFTNVISFTGGSSPTIQLEYDFLDDAGTPASVAIWKPTALSAAGQQLVNIGSNIPFVQSTAADNTAPTGFAAMGSLPAGLTVYSIPVMLPPNGQIQWTVTGTPTAIAWTAFLYGIA